MGPQLEEESETVQSPQTNHKMHDTGAPDASPETEPQTHECDLPPNASPEALDKRQQTIQAITNRSKTLLSDTPHLPHKPLMELNTLAATHIKTQDYISAAALYAILFTRVQKNNLTHPELYVCHSNCAAVYLNLALFDEALQQAETCRRLAEQSLRRNGKASTSYIKSFERKGRALLGLSRHREAAKVFEQGLQLDAFNLSMKKGLEKANQGILEDLVIGRGLETRSITYPDPSQRISYHPYNAPLHKVRTEDMLPVKLLTPFQAENDHNIKDTYNYVTVQTDIQMPKRRIHTLQDSTATTAFHTAIQKAVSHIESQDKDCRVLNLGAGSGLHAALALRAGATHVTAVERWLYLALTCKETLVKNNYNEDQFKVVYKRPSDVKLHEDVPISCNLAICNIFDEGLLAAGAIPAMNHALLSNLLLPDAVLLPSSATVYMQAVELRTTTVCELDMSAANLYRWHAAYAAGGSVPIDFESVKVLSKPVEVWYFDFGSPPDKSDVKTVDVEFTSDGRFNAIVFWYDLHLYGDIHLSTAPRLLNTYSSQTNNQKTSKQHQSRQQWMQPAIQYLAGELPVTTNTTLPIIASHNTVKLQFDIETADYVHLAKPNAAFSHRHFDMLRDEGRIAMYDKAIQKAIQRCREQYGEVHVLDMGCGTGVLSLLAARAGADSVVACDISEAMCDITRKAAAANKLADRISVVHRDVGSLQRGRDIRPLGVNMVVADMFDAGFFGDQFPYLLELVKKKVVLPEAVIVPSNVTVYCMGVQLLTGSVRGVDMGELDKYRWEDGYEGVRVDNFGGGYKRLTDPVKVLEQRFDGDKKGRGRETLLKLPIIEQGLMNGVVFWFDLHLDEDTTLSNAPGGIGAGGVVLSPTSPPLPSSETNNNNPTTSTTTDNTPSPSTTERRGHYWGQALQYLDRAIELEPVPGRKVTLIRRLDGGKLSFSLRQGIGDWVDRAPWKIEWGGGASVENPHYQRVHYCELLVRDFLMRVKSKRFPSIEKDMKMVLAHCGSLFCDPGALQRIAHELVVLERIHGEPEFSPGLSLEAITRPPLRLC